MSEARSVSFIVPCFNEELNIDATVEAIRSSAEGVISYEIILINDASTDGTLERMRRLSAAGDRLRVLNNPVNLGLGGSYKRGVASAALDYLMLIPGDNGYPPQSIRRLLDHIGEADMIIPYVENAAVRSRTRAFISKLYTTTLNWLFWLDLRYYNGIVVHRTTLLRTIQIVTNSFAFEAEAIIKLISRGATYVECPVTIQERAAGASSAVKLKNVVAVLKAISQLVLTVGPLRCAWLSRADRQQPPYRSEVQ